MNVYSGSGRKIKTFPRDEEVINGEVKVLTRLFTQKLSHPEIGRTWSRKDAFCFYLFLFFINYFY